MMKSIEGVDVRSKRVLFRPDINSPIDQKTKRIVNTNRLEKAAVTLKLLLEGGAKVAIIAHQGDTMDYRNIIPMAEHAEILKNLTGFPVSYIDDVCGPAAQEAIESLSESEAILLGNVRYLSEEITAFEKEVKLTPTEMQSTYLIRSLKDHFDLYVNDAFSAAHRSTPSMVAFQEFLPTYAGRQLMDEYSALSRISEGTAHPRVFLLGGGKISDAFGMMDHVLSTGSADAVLTGGLTGHVIALASGVKLGSATEAFLAEKDFIRFIAPAKKLLEEFPKKVFFPLDFAFEKDGERAECTHEEVEASDDRLYLDIGAKTIALYTEHIARANTLFVNGPAGVYEDERWENGTRELLRAVSNSTAYSVIGGGDTITAAARYTGLDGYSYVCTAGGAMIQFLSGKRLPLLEAMKA